MKCAPVLRIPAAILCAALLCAAGCGRSPITRFYTLNTLTNPPAGRQAVAAGHGMALGLGPVLFPAYLDRPQIVTRVSPNEVKFAEFHRWAASLKDEFSSKLAQDLSILLATDRVALFPWTSTTPVDVQVKIDVIRFDGVPGKRVVLQATWAIYGKDRTRPRLSRDSAIDEAVEAKGYQGLVAAQSRAVARLGREIAAAIRSLPPEAPAEGASRSNRSESGMGPITVEKGIHGTG